MLEYTFLKANNSWNIWITKMSFMMLMLTVFICDNHLNKQCYWNYYWVYTFWTYFYLKLSRKNKFLCSVWSYISTVCVTVFFLILSKKLLCSQTSWWSIKCFHKSKVQKFVLFLNMRQKWWISAYLQKVTCFYYKLWFCVILSVKIAF